MSHGSLCLCEPDGQVGYSWIVTSGNGNAHCIYANPAQWNGPNFLLFAPAAYPVYASTWDGQAFRHAHLIIPSPSRPHKAKAGLVLPVSSSGTLPVSAPLLPTHTFPSPVGATPGKYPASCPNCGEYGFTGWPCVSCNNARYCYGNYVSDLTPIPLMAILVAKNIAADPYPEICKASFEVLLDFFSPVVLCPINWNRSGGDRTEYLASNGCYCG
jgi:hypothetical protein